MDENGLRRLKTLRIVLAIMLVVLTAVLLALGLSDFSGDTFSRGVYNILHAMAGTASSENTVQLGNDGEYLPVGYKDGIVRLTRSVFSVYSSSLVPYSTQSVMLRNPALCSAGDTVVVYDRGGMAVYVFDSFDLISSFTASQTIYSADVASNGRFCLVTSADGYRGSVSIYNRSATGKVITWNCADCYLFGASFADECLYVVGFRPDYETTDTVVYRLNSQTGEVEDSFVLDGQMPLQIHALHDGSLGVVCEYGIWLVSEDVTVEAVRFAGEIPSGIVSTDSYLLYSVKNDVTGMYTVTMINHHGQTCFSLQFASLVDMQIVGDNAYILTEDSLFVYDSAGIGVKTVPADGNVLRVITDGTHLFYVTSHEVYQPSF